MQDTVPACLQPQAWPIHLVQNIKPNKGSVVDLMGSVQRFLGRTWKVAPAAWLWPMTSCRRPAVDSSVRLSCSPRRPRSQASHVSAVW